MLVSQQFVKKRQVLYDATGGSGSGFNTTWSWNHVLAPNANAICVGMEASGSLPVGAATCGGVSMTAVAAYSYSSGQAVSLFALLSPPTGSQTITVTSPTSDYGVGTSVSYKGVNIAATNLTSNGWTVTSTVGANLSSLSSYTGAPAGSLNFVVLGSNSVSGGFTFFGGGTYSGNTRFSANYSGFVNYPCLIGDITAAESNVVWTAPNTAGAAGLFLYS